MGYIKDKINLWFPPDDTKLSPPDSWGSAVASGPSDHQVSDPELIVRCESCEKMMGVILLASATAIAWTGLKESRDKTGWLRVRYRAGYLLLFTSVAGIGILRLLNKGIFAPENTGKPLWDLMGDDARNLKDAIVKPFKQIVTDVTTANRRMEERVISELDRSYRVVDEKAEREKAQQTHRETPDDPPSQ